MTSITVYTKPACPQCEATKRLLTKLGVEYEAADLMSNSEVLALAKAKGIQSAPVVVAGDEVWGGFDKKKCEELALSQSDDVWG